MSREFFNELKPDQRAEALYYYFGWQGGAIHQLAQATGCSSQDLLYRDYGDESLFEDLSGGFSAVRTCDKDWRVNKLAPKEQGKWKYWRDVIQGYWITGALKGE